MSQLAVRVFGDEDVDGRLARPLPGVVLEIAQVERCEGRRALCDPARRHDVICEGGVHAVADGCQRIKARRTRSEEHTSELQSHSDLVCRLLLEKKKKKEVNVILRRICTN